MRVARKVVVDVVEAEVESWCSADGLRALQRYDAPAQRDTANITGAYDLLHAQPIGKPHVQELLEKNVGYA